VESVPEYELLDAGAGRRLERFASVVIDRPAPAMAGAPRLDPPAWAQATARYERAADLPTGTWTVAPGTADRWQLTVGGLRLELRRTPAGQVGVFPEHVAVARWAARQAAEAGRHPDAAPAVLNLFAYTGLATLAMAAAGAAVVHVDASRPAVAWARRNAELSGLAGRPVRWLVDDARRFVAREERRGRRYDGVILDPPSYGHGPRGSTWALGEGLGDLIRGIGALLVERSWFVACTAHSTGLDAGTLERLLRDGLGRAMTSQTQPLEIRARSGAVLPAGLAVLAQAAGTVNG
jgi:23S rRNA (cytosine1962-C5)-methyltransferase